MKGDEPTVYLVDDDLSVREGVTDLLSSVGLHVEAFGSPQEFLDRKRPDALGCLILDVRVPGPSGLEFQRLLANSEIHLPIIFISAHGDIAMSVRAIKSGAIEFLTKPFRHQELLDAINIGIERDRAQRGEAAQVAELRKRHSALTQREREIMALVIVGRVNKQIAADLEISEATVKVHRGQIMRKMQAQSLPELVHMGDALKLAGPKPPQG